ncbi:MAG: lysylphosphatidylglycerol synthase transmembrane domain-containing protein [Verrucomicrobiota bacterium]
MSEMVERERSGSKLKPSVGFWIRLVVASAIIGLIAWNNDWVKFWQEFSNADFRWLTAAFVAFGLALFMGAFRWMCLLRVQKIALTFGETWKINMIGFFFNQFLFGSTGGDLIKIFYAIRKAPDRKAQATLSMIMDRVLGLVAILAVTFLLLPWEWERLTSNEKTRPIIFGLAFVLSCVFCGLTVMFIFPVHKLPLVFHKLWLKIPKREIFEDLYQGMFAHLRETKHTLSAVIGAIATVIPLLSIGWLLAKSLHLDIHYGPMTILFAIVLCAMSIPLFPGGHGIREGAFFLLFGVFGVTRQGQPVGEETALACSTLFLLINLGWSMIGGIVYLFFSSQIKKSESVS